MIDKVWFHSFLLLITMQVAVSVDFFKTGLANPEQSDTFHPDYKFDSAKDPVNVICMIRGKNEFEEKVIFTKSTNLYQFGRLIFELREKQEGKHVPLTVYIEGMGIHESEYSGDSDIARQNRFKAIAWGETAGCNICYITHIYQDQKKTFWQFLKDCMHISKSSRLQFVARIAYELIVQVYFGRLMAIWAEVMLLGFSYGGQMAVQTSRDLSDRVPLLPGYDKTALIDPKLEYILALDPASVVILIGLRIVNRNDAKRLQVLHTDPGYTTSGLKNPAGTVDIYVTDIPRDLFSAHAVAPFLHEITSLKLCTLFASLTGPGRDVGEDVLPGWDEVMVGVYNKEEKTGVYYLSFNNACIQRSIRNYEGGREGAITLEIRASNPSRPSKWFSSKKDLAAYDPTNTPIPAFQRKPTTSSTPGASTSGTSGATISGTS